jgi:hypothetical protein
MGVCQLRAVQEPGLIKKDFPLEIQSSIFEIQLEYPILNRSISGRVSNLE